MIKLSKLYLCLVVAIDYAVAAAFKAVLVRQELFLGGKRSVVFLNDLLCASRTVRKQYLKHSDLPFSASYARHVGIVNLIIVAVSSSAR